jgi:hypothetical protein
MALVEVAMDRRDAIYAELGVPPEEPEDPLDRWRRMKAEREKPQPRERKLDIVPPTLAEIDQRIEERIAAEHEFMMGILAEVLAQIQSDAEMRGPPGPAGPRGEQGPPGLLAMVKLWIPETVYYEGDVVAYDGGTFQAKRDTGQPPSHADWTCLATAGRETAAASSRSRMHRVPARVVAGSSSPVRASAGPLVRRECAASAARRVIQD